MRSLRHGRGAGRRLVALVALGLLVGACGGGQAAVPSAAAGANPQADKLAQILDRGTLVGYAETDYPPQSMLVEGATRPAGHEVPPDAEDGRRGHGLRQRDDQARRQGPGRRAVLRHPSWTEVTAGGWSDRWDIVYGSGSINRDRMKRLYMTQPYYATPNLFFVRAEFAVPDGRPAVGQADRRLRQLLPRVLPQARARDPRRHPRVRHQGPGRRRVRDRGARGSRRSRTARSTPSWPRRLSGRRRSTRACRCAASRSRRSRSSRRASSTRARASTWSRSPTGSTRSSAPARRTAP